MKDLTPYAKAWEAFSMTPDFVRLVKLCQMQGEEAKYAINRLRVAFDAGWNAKTSMILEALNALTKSSE